jgi:hypothetical protein
MVFRLCIGFMEPWEKPTVAFPSHRHESEYYYGKFIRASTLMGSLMDFHLLFPVLSRSAVQEVPFLA